MEQIKLPIQNVIAMWMDGNRLIVVVSITAQKAFSIRPFNDFSLHPHTPEQWQVRVRRRERDASQNTVLSAGVDDLKCDP